MLKSVYFAAVCLLVLLSSECGLGLTSPNQLLCDARAICDIAHLRFDSIASDDHAWILIRITPDPQSGSAMLPGTAIDAAAGKVPPPWEQWLRLAYDDLGKGPEITTDR